MDYPCKNSTPSVISSLPYGFPSDDLVQQRSSNQRYLGLRITAEPKRRNCSIMRTFNNSSFGGMAKPTKWRSRASIGFYRNTGAKRFIKSGTSDIRTSQAYRYCLTHRGVDDFAIYPDFGMNCAAPPRWPKWWFDCVLISLRHKRTEMGAHRFRNSYGFRVLQR